MTETTPRIAVVTPYYDEPLEWLSQCWRSVSDQCIPVTHFFVGDGPETPSLRFPEARCHRLKMRAADFGETPRRVGCELAMKDGFDAVAYLDGDNWFHKNHLSSLIRLHRDTGMDICTSRRTINHMNGTLLGYCQNSDGYNFCDTNCLMFFANAFHWMCYSETIASELKPIGDRILWNAIRQSGENIAHSGLYTTAYRSKFKVHYEVCGVSPPPELEPRSSPVNNAMKRWVELGNPALSFEHQILRA